MCKKYCRIFAENKDQNSLGVNIFKDIKIKIKKIHTSRNWIHLVLGRFKFKMDL